MDLQDILFSDRLDLSVKEVVLRAMQDYGIHDPYLKVLTPTATNDDVNGSQHVSNGGTDFTYRDAEVEDVAAASTLGYYEYFSGYYGDYTGHYYNGDGHHFAALVVDPPAYAADYSI